MRTLCAKVNRGYTVIYSMSAGIYNFEIEQGSTFSKDIVYKPGGIAADLTGYSATLIAKCNIQNTDKVLDLSTADAITITPITGTITIDLPASFTTALTFKEAFYELILITGAIKKRILKGKITLSPGVL